MSDPFLNRHKKRCKSFVFKNMSTAGQWVCWVFMALGVEKAIGNNALLQALSVFILMISTRAFAEDALARAGVPALSIDPSGSCKTHYFRDDTVLEATDMVSRDFFSF